MRRSSASCAIVANGRKDDAGKARWDLIPQRAMSEVVDVLTFGANKYAPNNWQRVPERKSRYVAAMFRHVVAWLLGERNDPETDKHHLAHACCCILFLLSEEVGFDPE